jgi:hypothetical protein
MFIGGEGDDIGVASGRYNTLFGGTGADQLWAFGERAYITGNEGDDYLVSTGNYGKIYGHSGDDIGVVIGAHNIMNLGEGDDPLPIINTSAPSPPVTLLFVPPKYSKSFPVPASMLLLLDY